MQAKIDNKDLMGFKNLKNNQEKKPEWIRVKVSNSKGYKDTANLMKGYGLNTVCEEAACPNISECWSQKHATVMIMGDTCTRACSFCNVKTGKPNLLDKDEPKKLAEAIAKLELSHVVITSVDRDDLSDGGAEHFVNCIKEIRKLTDKTTIEILTPDFLRKDGAIERVAEAMPDVFNHNIETVPALYQKIRPGARYFQSLYLLKKAKEVNPRIFTKSGLMVGLGESKEEILQVMDDMRVADIDFLTIGQYLRPTSRHAPVDRYVHPDEFLYYKQMAYTKGFLMVSSSPMTRSSYHAGEDFIKLRDERKKRLENIS